MDKIFKALSDSNRRKMLDFISTHNGINVNELTSLFNFSRFAVMKHLKILEEAELVVHQRQGKFKKLYVNAIPIQMIYDRWISGYSRFWASGLTSTKYKLEEAVMSSSDLSHVYVIYIKAPVEKVWDAIVNPSVSKQYYFGTEVKTDLTKGNKIEYHDKNENSIPVFGEIIESIPNKKLVHTFNYYKTNDAPSRVTYKLEETPAGVKLTLIHDQFDSENETYKSVREGWPMILSGLKTYVETGKALVSEGMQI